MILAGPWLQHLEGRGKFSWQGAEVDVAEFYRRGHPRRHRPAHPEYWGDITDYAQHLVEMASLAWGLHLSRHLSGTAWRPREEADRRLHAPVQPGEVPPEQLAALQRHHQRRAQDAGHAVLAGAHRRQPAGLRAHVPRRRLVQDGKLNRIDYYNAWGFLYYYLLWAILDGDSQAGRWPSATRSAPGSSCATSATSSPATAAPPASAAR